MNEQEKQLQAIAEIRDMMSKSSRFISLSGLSGVCAGLWAIIGAAIASFILFNANNGLSYVGVTNYLQDRTIFLLGFVALGVLVMAISSGIYFTTKKAKKDGLSIWDETSMRVVANLAIPLIVGGAFCLILLYHGIYGLVAPSTLIFYGLALINASKYTLHDIRLLGFLQIVIGFCNCFLIGYGLFFWALGFGILHIIYGVVMYWKYERPSI